MFSFLTHSTVLSPTLKTGKYDHSRANPEQKTLLYMGGRRVIEDVSNTSFIITRQASLQGR